MTDEDDDRAVGFLNSDRMTLAIIVGNARRHDFVSMRASAQHDCKTDKRSRDAVGAIAVDGYSGCHRFRPRPASVGNKAIGAAIIPDRLEAARKSADSIYAGQDVCFLVRA